MLTAIIITTIILSACSQTSSNAHTVVYNTSVDVPLYQWTSTDTLFYPIVVEEEPNVVHPIETDRDYHVRVSMRHTINFPLNEIPAAFCLQQTDTVQGQTRIMRRVMQSSISPKVRNEHGMPIGTGWGSLYELQETLADLTVRFDKTGTYRILIVPALQGAPEGVNGMASIGIELFE